MQFKPADLRRGVTLVAAIVALAAPSSALGAGPVGSLAQLAGTAGCNQAAGGSDGCSSTTGIAEANAIAISPDGKNAYAVSDIDNSVVEFSRNPVTGALTQLGAPNDCIAQGGSVCGTTSGRGLFEATAVAVSSDGKNVYVASSGSLGEGDAMIEGPPCSTPSCAGSVAVFKRDPATGVLTQLSSSAGCFSETASLNANNEPTCTSGTGLGDANSVVVSPQGDHVYVSAGDSNAIAEFKRDAGTGALTQLASPNNCIAEAGSSECGTTTAKGMSEAFSLAISSDGASVYAAAQGATSGTPQTDGGLAAFHRDAGSGALTQLSGGSACVAEGGADGCTSGRGLASASGVAVSRDGNSVYVVGSDSDAVAAFSRDAGSGGLTQLPGTAGCLANLGGDGCATATGLRGGFPVVVAPDGASVYVGSSDDSAVSEFARNPGTGGLAQLPPPDDCIRQGATVCGTSTGRAMSGIHGMAISGDGEHLYAANTSGGSLAAFERADPPPTCSTTNTLVAKLTGVALSCADPTGMPLLRSIVSGPAHGVLGAIDQFRGTVPYRPRLRFGGADSFSFQASDGSETSSTATAVLNVMAITKLGIHPRSFYAAGSGRTILSSKKKKVGTRITYRDSVRALTIFTVLRRAGGVKKGRRCIKPPRHVAKGKRLRRCIRYLGAGSFKRRDRAGRNSFRFTGRVKRHKLKPGRYKLSAVPTLGGKKGPAATGTFRVLRP